MASPTLPVFREVDAHSDQLQIDTDAAFRTTLQWLRIDSQGCCIQNKVTIWVLQGGTLLRI